MCYKILTGCGGSVSLLVRPRFTLLYFTLMYILSKITTALTKREKHAKAQGARDPADAHHAV